MIFETDLREMYLKDHMTLAEIAVEFGCTKQNVHYYLKRYGIDAADAERFDVKCGTCGKSFEILRCRYDRTEKHFCSTSCRVSYLRSAEYRELRRARRVAKHVIEEADKVSVPDGAVIGFRDGDYRNTAYSNLKVFGSTVDHATWVHRGRPE